MILGVARWSYQGGWWYTLAIGLLALTSVVAELDKVRAVYKEVGLEHSNDRLWPKLRDDQSSFGGILLTQEMQKLLVVEDGIWLWWLL